MQEWAASKQLPGLFVGSTGVNILSQKELMGNNPKNQAWVKKVSSWRLPYFQQIARSMAACSTKSVHLNYNMSVIIVSTRSPGKSNGPTFTPFVYKMFSSVLTKIRKLRKLFELLLIVSSVNSSKANDATVKASVKDILILRANKCICYFWYIISK